MTNAAAADDIRTLFEMHRKLDRTIRGNGRRLAKLAKTLSVATGSVCPECNSTDTEDNGFTAYRCGNCDHRWGTEYGERYGF